MRRARRECPANDGCFAAESSRRNCSLCASAATPTAAAMYARVLVSKAVLHCHRTAPGLHPDDTIAPTLPAHPDCRPGRPELPAHQPHSSRRTDTPCRPAQQDQNPVVRDLSIGLWRAFADLDLADARTTQFRSMHDCFTRQLRDGARPIDPDDRHLTSPS